jgi:hypothetical protein
MEVRLGCSRPTDSGVDSIAGATGSGFRVENNGIA